MSTDSEFARLDPKDEPRNLDAIRTAFDHRTPGSGGILFPEGITLEQATARIEQIANRVGREDPLEQDLDLHQELAWAVADGHPGNVRLVVHCMAVQAAARPAPGVTTAELGSEIDAARGLETAPEEVVMATAASFLDRELGLTRSDA